MNKELAEKIIEYLKRLEENEFSQKITSKKKNLLLAKKKEYEKLAAIQKDYQDLVQEADNKEEQNLFQTEITNLEKQKEQIINVVKEEIIAEEGTEQDIVMEIRPGTGGTEAGLFARDLFAMYNNFVEKKGEEVFKYLKNEAGVHRVQRVPRTESRGRIHTSTASVVVLPEAQDIALNILPQDLRIETSRSGGAGGQHVNTTDSKVQITHLPTGIVAISQDGRSQHDNKARALFTLKSRLLEKLQSDKEKKTGNLRSSMIGTAERSEKIRTYNYPQNRITDHRLGISWKKLNIIVKGDLEEVCQKLIDYEVEKKLAQ
ncbi:6388_t:CDS:2 [Ambispora gerdemannii]|uniref:6388_t:CDS:1 n=1 Tax=Ambispora gerdemannii TaxID=144530 RepID=A0A9N9E5N8_9GLOM|nr:6388_t:CDS:2 [Ambispora gerdemannii]